MKIIANISALELFKTEYIRNNDLTHSEELLINDFFKDLFENHNYKKTE